MADVDTAQLKRYIEVEKKIQSTQGVDELKRYEEIERQVEDVSQTIKTMEITVAQLEMKTKKEKKDVDDLTQENKIKTAFSADQFQQQLSKEQEEYLAALNEEEVAKQNLDGLKKQLADYKANAEKLKGPASKLKELYEERDALLSDIFNGEYGSELENKLEAEFDDLTDRKQRVSVANFKWINARVLLQHAVNQLNFAVQRWNEIYPQKAQQQHGQNMNSPLNPDQMYRVVTEARNNLIAASQNIQACHRYFGNTSKLVGAPSDKTVIDFPYVKLEEVAVLNKAITNCYTDCNSCDRHTHAAQCYDVTRRRAAALLQWFDTVINGTIQQDLKKVTEEARVVEAKLRAERVGLIRAKVEESGGNVGDLNVSALAGPTGQQQMQNNEPEGLGVVKPENVDNKSPDSQMDSLHLDERELSAPTPVPLNRLAPPPSQDEIFGNISKIKNEYEKNTQEFQKTQDLNKARLEQNLQSKLEARRHKKKM